MSKSVKVACATAFSVVMISFAMAYGAINAASAKSPSFEAPVTVDPAIATPVELSSSSNSSQSDAVEADPTEAEAAPASLADLVAAYDDATPLDAEARCLAATVFFEARSESLAGQLAVANVVLDRSRSGRFPDSLCGVITQPGQFGFVRKGRIPAVPTSRPAWRVAKAIAQIALDDGWRNPVEGALYFHATYSAPGWGREQIAQIGHHIFYR